MKKWIKDLLFYKKIKKIIFENFYQTLKALNIQVDLVYALIFGISTMSGLSILDKDTIKNKVDAIKEKLNK